jgi:sugar-specific transcriptional regulator TrmB
MKECTKCGLSLPDSAFSTGRRVCRGCRNKRSGELYRANVEVNRIKKKNYRASNPEKMRQRHKRWNASRLKKAREVRERFSSSGCAACGVRGPAYIFDFHHVGNKLFSVNGPSIYSKRMSDVLRELDKCIVLCAICHRRLHNDPESIRDSIKGLAEKEKAYCGKVE